MYDQERLCLYLPGSGEWSGGMSLAHTVIPWVSVWLFYYELWHATGEGFERCAGRRPRNANDRDGDRRAPGRERKDGVAVAHYG